MERRDDIRLNDIGVFGRARIENLHELIEDLPPMGVSLSVPRLVSCNHATVPRVFPRFLFFSLSCLGSG